MNSPRPSSIGRLLLSPYFVVLDLPPALGWFSAALSLSCLFILISLTWNPDLLPTLASESGFRLCILASWPSGLVLALILGNSVLTCFLPSWILTPPGDPTFQWPWSSPALSTLKLESEDGVLWRSIIFQNTLGLETGDSIQMW